MMQKGVLIICGDAAAGVADSMYAGTVFVAGTIGDLGADAVHGDVTQEDRDLIASLLDQAKIPAPPQGFRKLVAGKKLWNFQKADLETWKAAL